MMSILRLEQLIILSSRLENILKKIQENPSTFYQYEVLVISLMHYNNNFLN